MPNTTTEAASPAGAHEAPAVRSTPGRKKMDPFAPHECRRCKITKDADDFPWKNKAKLQRNWSTCKTCMIEVTKEIRNRDVEKARARDNAYHHANKEKRNAQRKARYDPRATKNSQLKSKYGITIEDYDRMHAEQNGVCAACQQPETDVNQHGVKSLAVDHSHITGKVRGLLCQACNLAIGHMREDRELTEKRLAYVETHL